MCNELDLLPTRDEMEPPKELNISFWGLILTICGILLGWVGGMIRTAWSLSKFDSRVIYVEAELEDLKEEKILRRVESLEKIAGSFAGLMAIANMSEKLEQIPQIVSDTKIAVEDLRKIVYKERGGLNVITVDDCKEQQFHCTALYKKDLEAIKAGLDQVLNSTSHEAITSLHKSVIRLESTVSKMGN